VPELLLARQPAPGGQAPPSRDRDFASRLNDPAVEFRAMSYPELFDEWAGRSTPGWLGEHVGCLRERYAVWLEGVSG
jgi:hypothetical protein